MNLSRFSRHLNRIISFSCANIQKVNLLRPFSSKPKLKLPALPNQQIKTNFYTRKGKINDLHELYSYAILSAYQTDDYQFLKDISLSFKTDNVPLNPKCLDLIVSMLIQDKKFSFAEDVVTHQIDLKGQLTISALTHHFHYLYKYEKNYYLIIKEFKYFMKYNLSLLSPFLITYLEGSCKILKDEKSLLYISDYLFDRKEEFPYFKSFIPFILKIYYNSTKTTTQKTTTNNNNKEENINNNTQRENELYFLIDYILPLLSEISISDPILSKMILSSLFEITIYNEKYYLKLCEIIQNLQIITIDDSCLNNVYEKLINKKDYKTLIKSYNQLKEYTNRPPSIYNESLFYYLLSCEKLELYDEIYLIHKKSFHSNYIPLHLKLGRIYHKQNRIIQSSIHYDLLLQMADFQYFKDIKNDDLISVLEVYAEKNDRIHFDEIIKLILKNLNGSINNNITKIDSDVMIKSMVLLSQSFYDEKSMFELRSRYNESLCKSNNGCSFSINNTISYGMLEDLFRLNKKKDLIWMLKWLKSEIE